MAGIISAVQPGSQAAALGLQTGDILFSVNGRELFDLIDYYYAAAAQQLTLVVRKALSGEIMQLALTRQGEEDLGIAFTAEVFDGVRPCRNRCLFCFIDQLQPQARPSLLLKDDDYRLSFLEGNYITGTNLSEADLQRIHELKLSPLYVSVHATDPVLRGHLLGLNQPAPIMPLLSRLLRSGVRLHTQIVLCPGLNDGAVLQQTVTDLASLYPGVSSAAIVPLGLTRFQRRPELRLATATEAAALLDWLERRQAEFLKQYGTRLVFAADEYYIRAGRPFPPARHYEDFAQLENGVGMAAQFEREWRELRRRLLKLPWQSWHKTAVVTGVAGAAALASLWPDIKSMSHGAVELAPVENSFYGPSVTVSGLLTGSCLKTALTGKRYTRYIIPDCMLKHGSEIFLDDMTVEELSQALHTPVTVAPSNAAGLFTALLGDDVKFGKRRSDLR